MPLWTCVFLFIFILVRFQKETEKRSMYGFVAEEEGGLEEHFVVEKKVG